MAIIYLDDGGDSTGDFSFGVNIGTTSIDTSVKHSGTRSYRFSSGAGSGASEIQLINTSETGRASFWFRFSSLPSTTASIICIETLNFRYGVHLDTGGKLEIATGSTAAMTTQLGSDSSSTLSVDTWYRICFTWNVTNSTTFTMKVFLEVAGVVTTEITANSGTLSSVSNGLLHLGWCSNPGATNKFAYLDGIIIDDDSTNTDIGVGTDVVAKHPAGNNVNNFDTSVGANPANRWENVDDVPINTILGWKQAGSSIAEESYTIESITTGVDITNKTIIANRAWCKTSRAVVTSCTFRAGAASSSTNPTTTMNITIPASTAANDSLFCLVTSRDHTSGTAYPTVLDNDTGGNSWVRIAESSDRVATLWWKRATSGTASKVITVAGCVGSCAGGVSVFQNAATSKTPYTNIIVEDNASANETHAAAASTYVGSSVVFGVFNYNNDNAVSSVSYGGNAMTNSYEHLSTGGSDCGNNCSYRDISNDTVAAANITWAQTNGVTKSISWCVAPEEEIGSPKIVNSGIDYNLANIGADALQSVFVESSTYPTTIGMKSGGTTVDWTLSECGIMIAFKDSTVVTVIPLLCLMGVGL